MTDAVDTSDLLCIAGLSLQLVSNSYHGQVRKGGFLRKMAEFLGRCFFFVAGEVVVNDKKAPYISEMYVYTKYFVLDLSSFDQKLQVLLLFFGMIMWFRDCSFHVFSHHFQCFPPVDVPVTSRCRRGPIRAASMRGRPENPGPNACFFCRSQILIHDVNFSSIIIIFFLSIINCFNSCLWFR